MPSKQGIDELTLRPIFLNINTVTYELARNLAKLLSPLNQSDYTISIIKEFTEIIKLKCIPDNDKLVSFAFRQCSSGQYYRHYSESYL